MMCIRENIIANLVLLFLFNKYTANGRIYMETNAILQLISNLIKYKRYCSLGGDFVSNKNKEKIMFTLPDYILSEVDQIVQMENSNREDFAKAAFQFYITQKKKINIKESMIKGYKEMAKINLSLAELGMTDDASLDNDSEGEIAKVE